ncbi:cell division ATP-binding protein FtsE [bacterium BMS3Bbin02]|nr:cell division ATP-binding protein FtsE [bacterium BMS3Bbin02]
MRILDRINRTGTTVVMATHDHAIVDAMRRRVVQLERGRIVRDQDAGGYQTLRRRKASPDTTGETPVVIPSDDETSAIFPSSDETAEGSSSSDSGAADVGVGEAPEVAPEDAVPDVSIAASADDMPGSDDSVESGEIRESDTSVEPTESEPTESETVDPNTDDEEETV